MTFRTLAYIFFCQDVKFFVETFQHLVWKVEYVIFEMSIKWLLRKKWNFEYIVWPFCPFCPSSVCSWAISVSCFALQLRRRRMRVNEMEMHESRDEGWVILSNSVSYLTSLVWGAAVCYCATLLWQSIWVLFNKISFCLATILSEFHTINLQRDDLLWLTCHTVQ